MKTLFAAMVALLALGFAATDAVAPAEASGDARVIAMGTSYPGVDELPIYIAQRLGYLKQENVDVNILSLSTGDKIIYALLGGSIDIARYTPDWIIRAVERGGSNLKIVLGSSNNLVFSLITQNAIHDYQDLKGKRIGVSTLVAADATLARKMMAAHGLRPSDYILIPAGASPERSAALRSGSLAAAILTPPADEILLDAGGFRRLDISTNVLKHYAWGGQAVRADWAQSHRQELVAYMRAWIRADRWLHDPANKAEVIRLLSEKARVDPRYATAEYDLYFGPKAEQAAPDGALDELGYQALINDMAAAGQFQGPKPSAAKFLDSSYWAEAERGLRR